MANCGLTKKNIKDALKTVLVLECSSGYGFASRITAAFGYGAATIGVSFEKEGSDEPRQKTGTPGWYNNMAFDKFAKEAGLESVTFNGDALGKPAESRRRACRRRKDRCLLLHRPETFPCHLPRRNDWRRQEAPRKERRNDLNFCCVLKVPD